MIIKFEKYNYYFFILVMGIGDWGLVIGDWGLGPIPNPQSPIPNPQSPIPINIIIIIFSFKKKLENYISIIKKIKNA